MALNFTPKSASSNRSTQAAPTPSPRPQVQVGQPRPSTARAEALKAKLRGETQPVAPRPAGSTARREQYAALQQHAPAAPPAPKLPLGKTSARQLEEDPSRIPPPPSGLRPGAEEPQSAAQPDNSVEPTQPAAEATNEPLSPQFVALARQEQRLRKAHKEFTAEKAAWEKDRANYVSKADLQADPLKALSEAGVSYERLVELQLNQPEPDPNQALHNRIAELEAKLNGVDAQFQQRDKQSYDSAVAQIRNDVQLLVDSDPKFETIKAEGQSEEVVGLIQKVFEEEGQILSVEEACQLIEDKLIDRAYERYQRLGGLQKIKQRLGTPAEPAEENSAQPREPNSTTTLSNQDAVQRPLTPRERAIRAFENAKR